MFKNDKFYSFCNFYKNLLFDLILVRVKINSFPQALFRIKLCFIIIRASFFFLEFNILNSNFM